MLDCKETGAGSSEYFTSAGNHLSVLRINIFLGHASPLLSSPAPTTDSADPMIRQNLRQREEELELIDQLRKVCTLPLNYTFSELPL